MSEMHPMIGRLLQAQDEAERPKLDPDIEAVRLFEALRVIRIKHRFHPGMVIRQKPACPLYQFFGDNGLVIVVEVLDRPVFDDRQKASSPYYKLPLDLRVGWIQRHGLIDYFPVVYASSERFEPVPAAELALKVKAP